MTSPLLTLNHLLILAKDIHDELGTPAANAAFEDELEGAIAYNETLMTHRLTGWEHFFKLIQFLESKVQKDLKAKGWKEALTITRQQLNSLKKEFATNPLMGKPMVMPTLVQP